MPDRSPIGIRGAIVLRGRARFLREDRILKRPEYQRVKQTGKNRHSPHFIISLAPNDMHRPRLGVVVTKRIGKAVKRNRVKRLLREFFRLHKGFLPSADIVIVAKKGAPFLKYGEVVAELRPLLVRSGQGEAHG